MCHLGGNKTYTLYTTHKSILPPAYTSLLKCLALSSALGVYVGRGKGELLLAFITLEGSDTPLSSY